MNDAGETDKATRIAQGAQGCRSCWLTERPLACYAHPKAACPLPTPSETDGNPIATMSHRIRSGWIGAVTRQSAFGSRSTEADKSNPAGEWPSDKDRTALFGQESLYQPGAAVPCRICGGQNVIGRIEHRKSGSGDTGG